MPLENPNIVTLVNDFNNAKEQLVTVKQELEPLKNEYDSTSRQLNIVDNKLNKANSWYNHLLYSNGTQVQLESLNASFSVASNNFTKAEKAYLDKLDEKKELIEIVKFAKNNYFKIFNIVQGEKENFFDITGYKVKPVELESNVNAVWLNYDHCGGITVKNTTFEELMDKKVIGMINAQFCGDEHYNNKIWVGLPVEKI